MQLWLFLNQQQNFLIFLSLLNFYWCSRKLDTCFTSEFIPGCLIDEATHLKKGLAWIPATNDLNEGIINFFAHLCVVNSTHLCACGMHKKCISTRKFINSNDDDNKFVMQRLMYRMLVILSLRGKRK